MLLADMPHATPLVLPALLTVAALLPAQDRPPRTAAALAAFLAEPAAAQQRSLAALRRDLEALDDPYHAALRGLLADAAGDAPARAARQRARRDRKHLPQPGPPAGDELAATVRYRFGLGVIELVHDGRREREAAARRTAAELALAGMLPETDAAGAELLRRLDTDTSADRFIGFLESWRNGPESFCQALDRTAGTPDSVFFYDAMLSDFVTVFAAGDDAGALRQSLDAAHDALHRAFLAYRQYRAFREAVVLSLVLPPDQPLPLRLRRYEEDVPAGYSIRQQVLMLLAIEGFDPRAVVARIAASAAPLPDPLWREPYQPMVAFARVFAAAMPAMIEQAGDTDAMLARAVARRSQLAARVRAAADTRLGGAAAGR